MIILSLSVVVNTGLVPALRPDLAGLGIGVCAGIHGVEPVVSGDDADSRVRQCLHLAEHDIFLVAGYQALEGDTGTTSTPQVMGPNSYLSAIVAGPIIVV